MVVGVVGVLALAPADHLRAAGEARSATPAAVRPRAADRLAAGPPAVGLPVDRQPAAARPPVQAVAVSAGLPTPGRCVTLHPAVPREAATAAGERWKVRAAARVLLFAGLADVAQPITKVHAAVRPQPFEAAPGVVRRLLEAPPAAAQRVCEAHLAALPLLLEAHMGGPRW